MQNQNDNFFLILFLGTLVIYLMHEKPKLIYKL